MGHHQWPEAVVDLEDVAARRGAGLLSGTNVYPVALAKLAEAYAREGDVPRSNAARRRLSEIWSPHEHLDR